MAENLNIALQITVVGMGLVFAAIILLWGLMALLVRLTTDRPEAGRPEAEPAAEVIQVIEATEATTTDEREFKRRAAAIGVSIALAAQQETQQDRPAPNQPGKFPLPATALVSAWQAVMRANQINRGGPRR